MRLARWMYVVLFAVACNRSDEDVLPAFIQSDRVSFTTLAAQGSNSSAISELWFYTDGDILGVVDTLVSLPLLKQGVQTITVFPGIKNNGMGTSRIRYPFYTAYDTTIDVIPGESYTIRPRYTYTVNATIDATRNFEAGNSFVESSSNSGTIELLNDPSLAASGVRCARMSLPAGGALLSYLDETNIALDAGSVAFLEMDYSCNNTFVVGVYTIDGGNSTKVPVLYLTPTQTQGSELPNWNKIYMDLGMVASQYPNTDNFRLYVECTAEEATMPTIYLDDIKVVK
jgi:hypothetical protein